MCVCVDLCTWVQVAMEVRRVLCSCEPPKKRCWEWHLGPL